MQHRHHTPRRDTFKKGHLVFFLVDIRILEFVWLVLNILVCVAWVRGHMESHRTGSLSHGIAYCHYDNPVLGQRSPLGTFGILVPCNLCICSIFTSQSSNHPSPSWQSAWFHATHIAVEQPGKSCPKEAQIMLILVITSIIAIAGLKTFHRSDKSFFFAYPRSLEILKWESLCFWLVSSRNRKIYCLNTSI